MEPDQAWNSYGPVTANYRDISISFDSGNQMTEWPVILSWLFMQLQSDKSLIWSQIPLVSPSAPHATDSADPNLNCAKLEPDPRWPDQWTQKYVTQNIHCLRSLMIDIREIINQSWHVSDSNDIKWIIGPSSSQSQRLETALPSQTCYSITDRIYEAQQSSSFLVTHQFLTCITHHTLQAEQIVTP